MPSVATAVWSDTNHLCALQVHVTGGGGWAHHRPAHRRQRRQRRTMGHHYCECCAAKGGFFCAGRINSYTLHSTHVPLSRRPCARPTTVWLVTACQLHCSSRHNHCMPPALQLYLHTITAGGGGETVFMPQTDVCRRDAKTLSSMGRMSTTTCSDFSFSACPLLAHLVLQLPAHMYLNQRHVLAHVRISSQSFCSAFPCATQ